MSPRRSPAPPHACLVCRTMLDTWEQIGIGVTWRHTGRNRPADGHDPVPVPVDELTRVIARCDFCAEHPPVWTYVFSTRPDPVVGLDGNRGVLAVDDDGMWSACPGCAELVDAGSPYALAAHVLRALRVQWAAEGRHIATGEAGIAFRQSLLNTYAQLLGQPRLKVPLTLPTGDVTPDTEG